MIPLNGLPAYASKLKVFKSGERETRVDGFLNAITASGHAARKLSSLKGVFHATRNCMGNVNKRSNEKVLIRKNCTKSGSVVEQEH